MDNKETSQRPSKNVIIIQKNGQQVEYPQELSNAMNIKEITQKINIETLKMDYQQEPRDLKEKIITDLETQSSNCLIIYWEDDKEQPCFGFFNEFCKLKI